MNIIRLTSNQRKQASFDHPLLSAATKMDSKAMAGLIKFAAETRNKQAFDDLILANLTLIKWIVGRYLYNWPETRRFEDDIASEGLVAVTQVVGQLDRVITPAELKAIIITKAKLNIETFLNDNRSLIGASLRTNYNRLEADEPVEYVTTVSFDDNNLSATRQDDALAFVDLWDTVEFVQETDKETFIDHVMAIMENYKGLEERELPLSLRGLIEQIVDIVNGTEIASED